MFKLIINLMVSVIFIVCAVLIARFVSDYLSSIILGDYLAYSGIGLLSIAFISIDKDNTMNRDFLTLITQRELVTRDINSGNDANRASLSLSFGMSGAFCLIVSGFMAWLH